MAFMYSCTKADLAPQESAVTAQGEENVVTDGESRYVANEVIVKFKKGLSSDARLALAANVKGTVARQLLTKAMENKGDKEGLFVLNVPGKVMDAIAGLKKLKDVVYAEPNFIYTQDAVSNDPYFTNGQLWGMYGDRFSPTNQYGSNAAEAWRVGLTGSEDVFVGVIDEGIMYNHEDLAGQVWTNPFDPADGVDNDGNGYVDDVNGWDFRGNDNSVFDGTGDDHGSHVSGTIGAKGGNGAGVAGVVWKVKIISAKFLGGFFGSGSTENAIKAVDYITDLKVRHGLRLPATNNSWGGGSFSQALQDAIGRAGDADILFVAAAGNSGLSNDNSPHYPSSYDNDNIISVANITSTGSLNGLSNYGATTVDIGAPGTAVLSTVPAAGGASGYSSYDGTSMATPHVTGAVALIASVKPGFSPAKIKSIILNSATPTPSLSGKCVSGGRLDISNFPAALGQ